MEYLMTYGWAILIIAVVLGALFSLGVFNGANFAPKAPPGACQVFRPNGPGSTSFINLEGVCSGELPEYVGKFDGSGTDYINIGYGTGLHPTTITMVEWVDMYTEASANGWQWRSLGTLDCSQSYCGYGIQLGSDELDAVYGDGSTTFNEYRSSAFGLNSWHMLAVTYQQNGVTNGYIDGKLVYGPYGVGTLDPGSNSGFQIAGPDTVGNGVNGLLANIQIYNAALSANEIQALYQEGIGGAPIDILNLTGWWPLNGNANDYSGNMNNGVPNNVVYTGSWESGYTAP